MSKAKIYSLSFCSNACLSAKAFRLVRQRLLFMLMVLVGWAPALVLAQADLPCDSLQRAWQYYYETPNFDRALALIPACESASALELRAYIACKLEHWEEAKTLVCRLLRQDANYVPTHAPPPERFAELLQAQRQACRSLPAAPPKPKAPMLLASELEVLDWMHWNVGYEVILGDNVTQNNNREEEYFPVLAHLRIGLGRVETEFRSIDIKNDLEALNDQLLLLSFKVRLIDEGAWHRNTPAVHFNFQTTMSDFFRWNTFTLQEQRYSRKLDRLRVVLGKQLGAMRLYAGWDANFSLENCIYPVTANSAKPYCAEGREGYNKDNAWSPYFAAQWAVGSWTLFAVSYHTIPVYRFENIASKSTYGTLDFGARIFFARTVAFDVKANLLFNQINFSNPIAPDLNSQNDWRIKAGVTLGFSLAKWLKQPDVF